VTFESAAYVARYVTKKVTGAQAADHYVNKWTGEVLAPEFVTMSRGGRCPEGTNLGGIGKPWLKKYSLDVYPDDVVISRGMKMKPPRFYDAYCEENLPDYYLKIKQKRFTRGLENAEESSPERLRVKEEIAESRLKNLKRKLEASV